MNTFKFTDDDNKQRGGYSYNEGEYHFPSFDNTCGPSSGVVIIAPSVPEAIECWKDKRKSFVRGYQGYMRKNPDDLS